jgi:hypothetical protein
VASKFDCAYDSARLEQWHSVRPSAECMSY